MGFTKYMPFALNAGLTAARAFGSAYAYRNKKIKQRIRRQKRAYNMRNNNKSSTKTITYMPSSKINRPLPECYHTRFFIENDGYYDGGSSEGSFTVGGNYLNFPFDQTTPLANAAIDTETGSPVGLAYLMPQNGAGPYTKYTVMSSSCQITARVESSDDIIEVVLIPKKGNLALNLLSTTQIAQQPMAKKMIVTNQKSGYISKQQNWAQFIGVPYKALRDDLSGTYDGDYQSLPQNLLEWYVAFQSKDGDVLAGKVSFNVKITYNVCLWSDTNGLYPDTQPTPP